jgi:hypothetical protein
MMTEEQSRVTPLNQAAAIYTVDFSLSPNTCLLTSGQSTNAKLLVGACKLTRAGTVINLGKLTGNKRYSSPHLTSSRQFLRSRFMPTFSVHAQNCSSSRHVTYLVYVVSLITASFGSTFLQRNQHFQRPENAFRLPISKSWTHNSREKYVTDNIIIQQIDIRWVK